LTGIDTTAPGPVPPHGARAGKPGSRKLRQRLRWIGITLASYLVDTLFLSLFAWAGTIPASLPLIYGLAGLLMCSGSYVVFSKGWHLRFSEAGVSSVEIMLASLLQCGVVVLAPQIAFPYLGNLFAVLSFGVLQLSLRQSALIWAVVTAAVGVTLFSVRERLGIPTSSPFELVLVWLYFATIIGRSASLSVFAHDLRVKLLDSKRALEAAVEQVRQLAIHDELTGAFNRRHMMARLQEEQARFERSRSPYCVALFDLDRFKSINDTHGHGVGDSVLKAFAAAAGKTSRETDTFGRFGGEEFLLILVETPLAPALRAVERIRERMRDAPWTDIVPGLKVTASVGVAESRPGESAEALLHRADAALYDAKHGGRDRVASSV
jgi:diguanylate cyclase (GGDEF)-like protein